ncbi:MULTISPECIES: DMT family transporter [Idiomarina]|jgi:drug/metabolite transporter (DMT)-like permease|uniref:DMT family transporter n=2 Tax=Idiomarinaceae TaxID=267893 RepID=UPI0006C867F6|nr:MULTISPECIES: DMT family transporter [Idiomarina]KPD21947.1 permease [Idiomarina abyssalis]MAB21166.1 EamA/RhaT family transporter [Idiomarina sp.]MBP57614.1 EamA/RhaT family transporter [Idiomarina sp.]MDA6067399.1 DMT family transporter [Idiomarina abyssalis]QZN90971.1 DMT family transporter [Idiomarina abyssalis]|tara:strand:- start:170 stop:1087 length:918 start_codon:yes stop_codon:yes gene_type:complete
MTTNNTPPLSAWLLLGLLALIWGSSFLLIKKGLIAFGPMEVGALRISSAGIVLAPFIARRLNKITRKHWLKLASVGLVGSLIPAFMFAIAQTQLASGVTGVLNALTPIATLVIGSLFFHQKARVAQVIGVGIGLFGTLLLVTASANGSWDFNLYALLVMAATVCYGLNLNLIKHKISDLSPLTITGISLLMAAVPATVYLFAGTEFIAQVQQPGAMLSLFSVLALGIAGTAGALVIFNHVVQLTNTVFTSSVTYLIPVVAVLLGVLDGEAFWLQQGVGMLAILVGVWFANRKGRPGLAGIPQKEQ